MHAYTLTLGNVMGKQIRSYYTLIFHAWADLTNSQDLIKLFNKTQKHCFTFPQIKSLNDAFHITILIWLIERIILFHRVNDNKTISLYAIVVVTMPFESFSMNFNDIN